MTANDTDNLLARTIRDGYRRGWAFTPLDGKRPKLTGWQNRPREALGEALRWASAGNVGLRTGRISGAVVVDADPGADVEALDLPQTVTALTGRDGARHYYLAHRGPLGNSAGKLGAHIDVKADGGQVVLPGSVHPDTGRQYRWAPGRAPWQIELAGLPETILARLNPPPRPRGGRRLSQRGDEGDGSSGNDGASDDGRRYATQALRLELNTLYQARPGSRNDTLNRAAFNLGTLVGAGLLDRDEVAAELLAAAEAIGLSRGEAEATIGSGLDSGSKHPRRPPPRPKAVRVTSPATDDWADEAVTLPPGKFKLNLYGNADRFCHLYGRDVLWCEQRGQWFVWDGRCWQPDALRRAAKLAEQTMRALLAEAAALDDKDAVKWAVHCNRSARAMKDLLEVVKHRVAVHSDVFDRDPWVLGIDNGVIDLRTGELHDHDRDRRISRLCPVRYDAEATCPRWQQFMVEIMGGDEAMVDALQRLAGYCLTGDVSVQILSILYGPGGNGKNVWLDTLMGILGPYATEAPEGLLTARQSDEHPTEIADLCGRRLVVASETEAGKKMRIGLVKKLTGNTYLKARFMRQDYFQFTRTHKTLLVTNNRPVVTETSNAVWRRLRLIPFDVTIPAERQDKRLTEKLITEWPGILAWAVRGCLDWQRRRRELDLPRCVAQATEAYRDDSDPVGQFVEEHCLKMAGAKVARSTLYQAYERWARDTGEPILGGKRFAARMRAMGFDECWTTEAGKRARAWGGLGLVAPMKETPGQWD